MTEANKGYESESVSPTRYSEYGAMHGTGFYFDGDDAVDFLVYMQGKIKNADAYTVGFMEGLTGKYARKFRFMKGKKDEKENTDIRA